MCQHRSMSRKYRMLETRESRVWQLDLGQICYDDPLLIYRQVSKCRLWLRRAMPSFYPCLRSCVFHAKFSDVLGCR